MKKQLKIAILCCWATLYLCLFLGDTPLRYTRSPPWERTVFSYALFEESVKHRQEQYPLNIVLGFIETEEEARRHAESIWMERFGQKVLDQKPYNVFFDESAEVWFVEGTSHPPSDHRIIRGGSVVGILISKPDGQVLDVWS